MADALARAAVDIWATSADRGQSDLVVGDARRATGCDIQWFPGAFTSAKQERLTARDFLASLPAVDGVGHASAPPSEHVTIGSIQEDGTILEATVLGVIVTVDCPEEEP